jgi:carboxypeptidase Q
LMSPIPASLTHDIQNVLGTAEEQSTDVDAFSCQDAMAFDLNSVHWDYNTYTWHTNRDTFDKISFDDVERTATLVALLAYEASEEPQQFSRAQQRRYDCRTAPRSWASSRRR